MGCIQFTNVRGGFFTHTILVIFIYITLTCSICSADSNQTGKFNTSDYYVRVFLKLKGEQETQFSKKINGLIISNDGYILTTNFIFFVRGKEVEYENILVELDNFKTLNAEYIARDEKNDLVLLKVDSSFNKFVTFKNTDTKIGDTVIVTSLWLNTPTVNKTKGIISAIDRMRGCAYQIDAKVDFASIGGLVTDNDGNAIGIVSFLSEERAQSFGWGMNSGVGFATKAKCIIKSLNELKKGKNISAEPTPFLGVQGDPGISDILGAKIKSVVPNTPAHKAGLKGGDIIVKFGEKTITEWVELIYAVSQTPLNSKIKLEVIRKDKKIQLELFLDKKRDEFVK